MGDDNIEIGTSIKTYTYENIFSLTDNPRSDVTNLILSSNIFRITPTEEGGDVELDVFIKVVTTGFYAEGQTEDLSLHILFGSIDFEEINVDQLLQSDPTENGPVYKYKVLQWGDEKKLLTDDALLNSFYFKWYNDIDLNLWDIKRYLNEYNNALYIKDNGIVNITEHIYETPGVKSIKAIIFRTDQFKTYVFESRLLTTNIVINDGILTSQDFSIFGGIDFNFLPLKSREAIIGGLDDNSKYITSIEKIIKDDIYDEEDFLTRKTNLEFFEKFTEGDFGNLKDKMDLGVTRVFKGTSDIYDFLMTDEQKGKAIADEFPNFSDNFYGEDDKVKFNSEATDIFINDGDTELKQKCMIEINPQKMEYLTIPNTVGDKDKGILIGDYKIKKEKNQPFQKEGIMEISLLEDDSQKQAF